MNKTKQNSKGQTSTHAQKNPVHYLEIAVKPCTLSIPLVVV